MIITDFILKLQDELSERDLSENSVIQYIKILLNLHKKIFGTEKILNLSWLKDLEKVQKTITENYKESSQKNIYSTLSSILSPYKEKKGFKNAYSFYKQLSEDLNTEIQTKLNKNIKSDNQEKNWITWEEVEKIQDELKTKSQEITNKKNISESEFETLLKNVVLSLYTKLPPRRNEYQNLLIVPTDKDLDNKKNYYVKDEKKIILNSYKTSKKYGPQEISVPEDLSTAIVNYLQFHPIYNSQKKKKFYEVPLLINKNNIPLTQVNSLTRLLNKIFKKNIGASMLRHIYLSSKYGDELNEMKADAEAMGHGLNVQKSYIKND